MHIPITTYITFTDFVYIARTAATVTTITIATLPTVVMLVVSELPTVVMLVVSASSSGVIPSEAVGSVTTASSVVASVSLWILTVVSSS